MSQPGALRLRDDVSVVAWPRWLSVIEPDGRVRTLESKWLEPLERLLRGALIAEDEPVAAALGDFLEPKRAEFEAGASMRAHLRQLDALYAGAIGCNLELEHEALESMRCMHATAKIFEPPRLIHQSLPSSVLRRVRLIESFNPNHILLIDDPDAGSIMLANDRNVTVLPSSPLEERWLAMHASEAGVESRLSLVAACPTDGSIDVAVMGAADPSATREALLQAIAALRVGGHLVLTICSPWDGYIHNWLKPLPIEPVGYQRDVMHRVLPGGYVIDGGGDLLVLRKKEGPWCIEQLDDALRIREQPYAMVELESLDQAKLDAASIDRFSTLIESLAPRPSALRDCLREDQRDLLWWYDIDGYGFSAELRRDKAHLAMTFCPLDSGIAYVALCAAFWTFADGWTRIYAQRTATAPSGMVMS